MDPRVLQAITGDAFGGTERFFERLVMALHRDGIQQLVILRAIEDRVERLRSAGLHPVPMTFETLEFVTRRRVRQHVKRFQPGLALAWTAEVVPILTGMGVPVLGRWANGRPLEPYRHCQHLLVHTGDDQAFLLEAGWPADRVHMLPPLVDQSDEPAVARRTLFTPQQAPLMFAAVRMTERRDLHTLLRALQRLPDVYLWIAGDGPERDALEHTAYELGIKPRVRFLGWRDDLAALYEACDLVLCTGTDRVPEHAVVEAWAHGKPVVAVGRPDRQSVLRPNENVLVLPGDDILTIVQGLKWVLAEPGALQTLGTRGHHVFWHGHTEAQVLAAYRGLFEHLARGDGA